MERQSSSRSQLGYAAFIFVIVLDYILRLSLDNVNDRGLRIQAGRSRRDLAEYRITGLVEDAEASLQSLEKAVALVRLYCNESKTEYISSTKNYYNLKSLSGANIKRAEDLKYLGSLIMDSKKTGQRATSFKSSGNQIYKKIINSSCFGILLYGAETWTLKQSTQRQLEGTYRVYKKKSPVLSHSIHHSSLHFAPKQR